MKNTVSLLAIILVLLTACKKKKEDEPKTTAPAKSVYEYMTQREWYVAERYVGPGDKTIKEGWRDANADLPDCYKDDRITFSTSGKIIDDPWQQKCSTEKIDSTRKWFFRADIDSFHYMIDEGFYSGLQEIVRLDDEVLEIYGPYFIYDSTIHMILRHP